MRSVWLVYWDSERTVFARMQLYFLDNANVAIHRVYQRQMTHEYELITVK